MGAGELHAWTVDDAGAARIDASAPLSGAPPDFILPAVLAAGSVQTIETRRAGANVLGIDATGAARAPRAGLRNVGAPTHLRARDGDHGAAVEFNQDEDLHATTVPVVGWDATPRPARSTRAH